MNEAFSFETDGLAASAVVAAFRGTEALSNPYEFEIDIVVPPVGSTVTEIDLPIGNDGTLRINRLDGSHRASFHGIITRFEFIHAHALHALYRVVLSPRLTRLALNEHSRVWVDEKIPDVIEAVFKANGMASADYELSLSKSYAARKHVCQYHESDFAFVSRWMEREGIYYFFTHDGDKEKLVLTDDGATHARLPAEPVRFYAIADHDTSAVEAFRSFRSRHGVVSEKVKLSDYDYLQPDLDIAGEAKVANSGFSTGVVSVFGSNLYVQSEAKRIAKVRGEQRASRQVVFRGSGRVYELRSGYRFEVDEHPVVAMNAEYLAVSVHHRGISLEHWPSYSRWIRREGDHAAPQPYVAEVTALKRDVPYRPEPKTPTPHIWGVESARVDGEATSEYAQLDDHGRYLVKILFDESDLKDGKASTRVRMMQPHAGEPEGFHFPLRKDTEVLLAFVSGDPDRPVIVGVGPHPQIPSPVTSANHTQNVVMTGGQNRIEIEDNAGEQYVQMFSPPENSSLHLGAHKGPYNHGHNFALSTDGNGLIHTGGDRNITVGAKQTEDVTGALTEDYHATQTTHVTGAFKETIDGGATQTIAAGETRTVTGGVTETISGGETRTVNGGQTETVNGSVTQTVSASVTDTIGAALTRTVGGAQTETIGGALSQTVAGGITITTPAAMNVTAVGGVTFKAPGGFNVMAPGGTTFVDDEWFETGGAKGEYYGFKFTQLGLKLETYLTGTSGAYGIKLETNGLKLEATGAYACSEGLNLKEAGAKMKAGALGLYMMALISMA